MHETTLQQLATLHGKIREKKARNENLLQAYAEAFRLTLASVLGADESQAQLDKNDEGWLVTLTQEGLPEPIKLQVTIRPRPEGGILLGVPGYALSEKVAVTDQLQAHGQHLEYAASKVADKLRKKLEDELDAIATVNR